MPAFSISEISPYLYISSFPGRKNAEQIRGLGIRLILSMYLVRPNGIFRQPPFRLLWTPVIDSPLTPIPLRVFHKGVQAALPVIDEEGRVLVHCRWGIHRSAAMACCILIARGTSVNDAVALVKSQRSVARPDEEYVLARIRKFEQDWRLKTRDKTIPESR
jgi:protein-tyrosine phosphatase